METDRKPHVYQDELPHLPFKSDEFIHATHVSKQHQTTPLRQRPFIMIRRELATSVFKGDRAQWPKRRPGTFSESAEVT